MIIQQENSKRSGLRRRWIQSDWRYERQRAAEYDHRIDRAMTTIERYGFEYFGFELAQYLKAERADRGYYPALPEVLRWIEQQYGRRFANQAKHTFVNQSIQPVLRLYGVYYHAATAGRDAAPESAPLLDLKALYAAPFGTVGNYLYWKLPRMAEGDAVTVNGVTIERDRRLSSTFYVHTAQGVYLAGARDSVSVAMARVFDILRGNTGQAVRRR